MKNIIVYGAGYVGLANGLLLARKNNVTIVDINKDIVAKLIQRQVHIDDEGCAKEIKNSTANFSINGSEYIDDADYIFLALPTNYDEELNSFDTAALDKVISEIATKNYKGVVVIKSTVPIGYTQKKAAEHKELKLVFSPEFLREGSSFADAENPSRIVFGSDTNCNELETMFLEVSANKPQSFITDSTSAEAIKLFSNTYLAMRVAFVNELATFARSNNLDRDTIINGVGSDPRIGNHYFKPSAGYGGYCLPKDSKQLRYEFNNKKVPTKLFDAIVDSNETREEFIINEILKSNHKVISINGIGHKEGVTNFRNSPKLDIAKVLRSKGITVEIVDKNFVGSVIEGFEIKDKSSGVPLESFI